MIPVSHIPLMARMSLVGPFSSNYADQITIQQYPNYKLFWGVGVGGELGYKEETRSIIQR